MMILESGLLFWATLYNVGYVSQLLHAVSCCVTL